jgi:hypothetical protein
MNIKLATSVSFQSIGYVDSKLYILGWRNRLHCCLPRFQHVLLSSFFYYRKGFADASIWAKTLTLEEQLH